MSWFQKKKKINNLFISRNTYEALDDPNWKASVMEDMHAQKQNGTREIVELPKVSLRHMGLIIKNFCSGS